MTGNPPATQPSLGSDEANTDATPPEPSHAQRAWLVSDVAFRHSGWRRQRSKVYDALEAIHHDSERVQRFRYCGCNAWVAHDRTDRTNVKIVADYCNDRFCRPCAATRGRTIARNIADHLKDRRFRFVTLTIKTDELSLPDALKKLYQSFAKLRQNVFWKRAVRGGCAFCEVKYNPDKQRWHPHLHLIVEGNYIDQNTLRDRWYAITKDSYIVDVRMGHSPEDAARYAAAYCTKSLDNSLFDDHHRLVEAMSGLHGRRLAHTFGTWRGLKLTSFDDTIEWVAFAKLSEVRGEARSGDVVALQFLQALQERLICQRTNSKTLTSHARDGPSRARSTSTTTPCAPPAAHR